ncbi:protein Star [Frankliniella occidentalis]|uniref:Protein Star n=1 Tax=Frankliniella occidentalis TaxID=133901 RepID=A0A6J1SZK7_FRAOC|nr:protein Star [Frankliniella occidentalis]
MERSLWRISKIKGLFILLVFLIFVIMMYQHNLNQPVGPVAHSLIIENDGLNGELVSQEDRRLITKIRTNYLYPPPPGDVPLNLTDPEEFDTSMGQSQVVKRLLKYKRNGFFIECGALDGEIRSNTLYLERYLGWSGLLIEGDPSNFALMVHKHRKAWLSQACLSLKPYPSIVSFKQNFNMGQVSDYPAGHSRSGFVDVQCFPLYSFLLALNQTTIDYFSLDVEGAELDVLQTIPWSKVNIKVLSVEFIHGPQGKDALQNYMESLGYRVVETVTHSNNLANDFILIKD